MGLDSLFQYVGPNKNPLFGFVSLVSGVFCYYGDKRLAANTVFLGYLMILFSILLVCIAVCFYIYLSLHAPNSSQARDLERKSPRQNTSNT